RRLGDLDDQVGRLEPGLTQRVAHAVDEPWMLDLAGGDVDAEEHRRWRQSLAKPAAGLGAGLAQDPVTDRHDGPCLLGDLDEPPRGDRAKRRVVPPDQRLDTR